MNKLREYGFVRYDLLKELNYEGIEFDYLELLNYFSDLPIDEYAPTLNRYRRYSRALILPGNDQIFWLPIQKINNSEYSVYFQGKFNPEFPESYRKFRPIDQHIQNNKLLNKIISSNFKKTFWNEEDKILPIHVGVHFVKLFVNDAFKKATSSPDCLHQDGEPFTFAHLIERKNVKGGTNVIASPQVVGKKPHEINNEDIIQIFELSKALESYGVHDTSVSHYVSAIEQDNKSNPATRSVILIDYQQTIVADINE
ncbi:2OG-Fe dioxygenase family protein [Staphylococcus aureus]|uniref:2OG-Fe dioxygenase family protein n=1 Tax=Staphylococcus aureus TaxID=1280 RepID=UPI001CC351C8|nr:2OG-Fe dioxygenase family protein [Staphylococcus aureus]MBZ5477346.1 2OG-Fe dioxygenase family protein [Staphylococcus aureus]